jgi:hypothetical protein
MGIFLTPSALCFHELLLRHRMHNLHVLILAQKHIRYKKKIVFFAI